MKINKSLALLQKIEESGATAYVIRSKVKEKLSKLHFDLAAYDKNVLLLSNDDNKMMVKTSYNLVSDLAQKHDCEVETMGE